MRKYIQGFAAIALTLLLASPAAASSFNLFGSWQDTDDVGEAAGGGVSVAFGLGQVLDLELRGTYYEELSNEPLDALFEDDDPVFEDGIQAIPIEAGLRFNLAQRGAFNPYISAGGTYYLLDSDFGDLDDEFGWYATLGSIFGDRDGASFFLEALYRNVEGSVQVDPEDLGDIDDTEFEDEFDIDLSGFGVNLGIAWRW